MSHGREDRTGFVWTMIGHLINHHRAQDASILKTLLNGMN